jgi:hypothetical protein
MKRSKLWIYKAWTNLKCILLNERNQTQWLPHYLIPFITHRKPISMGTGSRSVIESGEGLAAKGYIRGG